MLFVRSSKRLVLSVLPATLVVGVLWKYQLSPPHFPLASSTTTATTQSRLPEYTTEFLQDDDA